MHSVVPIRRQHSMAWESVKICHGRVECVERAFEDDQVEVRQAGHRFIGGGVKLSTR